MAIPLFRLPILVIKLILETMGFIDIFVLTSTSSKTKRIFKNLVKVRNHEMQIFMDKEDFYCNLQRSSNPDFLEQIYSESGNSHPKDVFYLRIGHIDQVPSGFSPALDGGVVLTIYWSKNVDHGKLLCNALIELFGTPISDIKMDLDGVASGTCKSWINLFNETLSAAFFLEIVGKCSFSDYVWILENVKAKNRLSMKAKPTNHSDTLRSSNINFTFKAETVVITDGKWIKMQHLNFIETRSVYILKVTLSDAQVNLFLRDWKDLKVALNMKKLFIFFEREADPEVVLEGMDLTDEDLMKPDDALNQWSFEMASGDKCTTVYAEFDVDVRTFGFEFQVGN